VGLLAPFGAPAVLTAAFGLLFEGILISGGLIGGIMAFLIGRISHAKDSSRMLHG
jgi:hypothetical protein